MLHLQFQFGVAPKDLDKLSEAKYIDILSKGLYFRYVHFEGERVMGAVADVTDIVMPKIEEAEKRGIQRGREEGAVDKAKEVARAMLIEGDLISKIAKVTALSGEDIRRLKSEMTK